MNRLEDDGFCFVCGPENPIGLKVVFSRIPRGVAARIAFGKVHQGYSGIVHGGLISTLLDEAMVKAAISEGLKAVTAELTVRFKDSLMAGEETVVEATVERVGRVIEASAVLAKASDGSTIAKGSAKLLIAGKEGLKDGPLSPDGVKAGRHVF